MNLENVHCGEKTVWKAEIPYMCYKAIFNFFVISQKLFKILKNILHKSFTIKLPLFIYNNNIFNKQFFYKKKIFVIFQKYWRG